MISSTKPAGGFSSPSERGSIVAVMDGDLQDPPEVFPAFLSAIRGGADYREPRTIDVHVRHLREKIEEEPREPELILTVRGAGYRFRDG